MWPLFCHLKCLYQQEAVFPLTSSATDTPVFDVISTF